MPLAPLLRCRRGRGSRGRLLGCGGLVFLRFVLPDFTLGGGGGGGHGGNGHGFPDEALAGGKAGGRPLAHHISFMLQGSVLHHREAVRYPPLGLLNHMGQLVAEYIHTRTVIQQDVRALGHRLYAQTFRDIAPADADIGEIRTEARLEFLPQLRRHGLGRAGAGQVQQLAPGGNRIPCVGRGSLGGGHGAVRCLAFIHIGIHIPVRSFL